MELISSINLSNENDYQSIYASQLYGTFFAVYGKFTLQKSTDPKYYLLDTIDLLVINYKGIFNIGISDHKFVYDQTNQEAILKLEVRAIYGDKTAEVKCKGAQFKKDGNSFLYVDRRVQFMHSGREAFKDGIFDEEFYYREGVELDASATAANSNGIPVYAVDDVDLDPRPTGFAPKATTAAPGSPKCPKSKNKIF